MELKLVGLFAVVILALVCLLGRVTYINATSGTKYKKRVLLRHSRHIRAVCFRQREAIFTIETEISLPQARKFIQ